MHPVSIGGCLVQWLPTLVHEHINNIQHHDQVEQWLPLQVKDWGEHCNHQFKQTGYQHHPEKNGHANENAREEQNK